MLRDPNRLAGLIVLVALLAALHADRAAACQCLDEQGWGLSRPADGEIAVPTDALFWTTANRFRPEHTLVHELPSLSIVPGDWASAALDTFEILTFRPRGGWSPNTEYSVRRYYPPDDGTLLEELPPEALIERENRRSTFRTSEHAEPNPPTVSAPVVEVLESLVLADGYADSCDRTEVYRVAAQVTAPHDGVFLLLRMDGQPAAYDGGNLTFTGRYFWGTTEASLRIGTQSCSAAWHGAAPGAVGTFELGTVDLAGNVRWTEEPFTVALPENFDDPSAGDVQVPDAGSQPADSIACSSVVQRASHSSSKRKPSVGLAAILVVASILGPRRRR